MSSVRSLLKDSDINSDEQRAVLNVARLIKRQPQKVAQALQGSSLGLLFEKPSLRTRVASETACTLLGAHPVILRGDEIHLHRGETPEDSAQVLSGYLDLLQARVLNHKLLERFAGTKALSVVNGLSDQFHPLQALADLLTIQESTNGRLSGLTLCYLGDCNNVANSLIIAGMMAGLHLRIGSPKAYTVESNVIEEALEIASRTGGSLFLTEDPDEAVSEAHAVYTDVWISMGDESEVADRLKVLSPYQLNSTLLRKARPDAMVLHCLPAHFDEEITREVFDSPQSRVLPQAHNRQPTAAAVYLFLLRRELFNSLAK